VLFGIVNFKASFELRHPHFPESKACFDHLNLKNQLNVMSSRHRRGDRPVAPTMPTPFGFHRSIDFPGLKIGFTCMEDVGEGHQQLHLIITISVISVLFLAAESNQIL